MFWDVAKELLPTLKDALKDGIRAAIRSKRKKRHRFILKAMASFKEAQASVADIARNLKVAQLEDAGIADLIIDKVLAGTLEKEQQQQRYNDNLTKQKRLGLPDLNDPERNEKLEEILHDMADDGDVTFWPPDKFSIRIHRNGSLRSPWS